MQVINAIQCTKDDFTTVYELSDGDTELIIPVSTRCSVLIEVLAGEFNFPTLTTNGTDLTGTLDGTVDFHSSTDGINKKAMFGASQIVLNAAQKIEQWKENIFEAANIHLIVAQNTIATGTIRIMITMKPINTKV